MRAIHRRRVHLLIAAAWIGPGAAASVLWATSLPWIVFMSWFACCYGAISAWAAETPVEEEGS